MASSSKVPCTSWPHRRRGLLTGWPGSTATASVSRSTAPVALEAGVAVSARSSSDRSLRSKRSLSGIYTSRDHHGGEKCHPCLRDKRHHCAAKLISKPPRELAERDGLLRNVHHLSLRSGMAIWVHLWVLIEGLEFGPAARIRRARGALSSNRGYLRRGEIVLCE